MKPVDWDAETDGGTALATPPAQEGWLTTGQVAVRGVQIGGLAVLAVVMMVVNPEGTTHLFLTPLGQKMLLQAALLLAAGVGLMLVAYAVMNRLFPPGDARYGVVRGALTGVMETLHFLIFYLPIVFVLLVGPAVVSIFEAMGAQ
jgi:hypothetical protein